MTDNVCSHYDTRTVQETHQEMRYPNVTSLYFDTPLAFNAPDGGVPLGNLRKILLEKSDPIYKFVFQFDFRLFLMPKDFHSL